MQPNRFNIIEEEGCNPPGSGTTLELAIVTLWPLLLGSIALLYCRQTSIYFLQRAREAKSITAFIVMSFLKHRRSLDEFLDSNASLNRRDYFRLLALGSVDAFSTVPLTAVVVWSSVTADGGLMRWPGWQYDHYAWSQVYVFPTDTWRPFFWDRFNHYERLTVGIYCSILFLLFYGVTDDARENYRRSFWSLARRFGRSPPVKKAPSIIVFNVSQTNPRVSG